MKRSLGRNRGCAAYGLIWLLAAGAAMAQPPAQQWQAAPDNRPNNPSNYPPGYPPSYQPSTGPSSGPAANPSSNLAAGPAAGGQYQYAQQPDQPVGPPQYPGIERRQPAAGNQPGYNGGPGYTGQPGYTNQPPDNRVIYPSQDWPRQGTAGQGPPSANPPAEAQRTQGPPVRRDALQAPFVLSPEKAAELDRLLADWEKRNKQIHEMESKFYRWKYDAVFGNGNQPPPYDEGLLKFAAPDKGMMKVEAKDPKDSEQWVCDGKSIFHFDYSKKEVTEHLLPREMQGKGIGDGPLPFVFGVEAERLKQRYFMRIVTPRDAQNQVWLEAMPRYQQQAAEFSRVQVILQIDAASKCLMPYAIQIYSPNGKDHVVYQLHNPVINPKGGWLPDWRKPWWSPSIPLLWRVKTDLPPPPIEVNLNPSRPQG